MNIVDLLNDQALKLSDYTAIVDNTGGVERKISFKEIDAESKRISGVLAETGLIKGDTIFILLPMRIELYTTITAVWRMGLRALFVDPASGIKHIESSCQLVRPKAFIGTQKAQFLRLICPAIRKIPFKCTFGRFPNSVNLQKHPSSEYSGIETMSSDSPALITFTSGSGGKPKAAVRSHGFLVAQHKVIERSLGLRSGNVDLTTLPIFLLANLASGVTSIIPDGDLRYPGRIKAKPIMAQISKFKPNTSAGSPAFYQRLVQYCKKSNTKALNINRVYIGGAPVNPSLLDELNRLAIEKVICVYGSTEAEPISHIDFKSYSGRDISDMANGRGLLVGAPIDQISVRILPDRWGSPVTFQNDQEFSRRIQEQGETGEIVVSGDHVLSGYLDGKGDEENKFDVAGQRWHRTGDAGYLDDKGRLWLLGRCSAKLIDRHGVLYPFTIETAAAQISGVRMSALVSHNNKRLLLLQETREGVLDLNNIKKTLNWASIDEFKIIKEIPLDKRHNAKIDYVALEKTLRKLN